MTAFKVKQSTSPERRDTFSVFEKEYNQKWRKSAERKCNKKNNETGQSHLFDNSSVFDKVQLRFLRNRKWDRRSVGQIFSGCILRVCKQWTVEKSDCVSQWIVSFKAEHFHDLLVVYGGGKLFEEWYVTNEIRGTFDGYLEIKSRYHLGIEEGKWGAYRIILWFFFFFFFLA